VADKKQWAKSTTGPDELDVMSLMKAMQTIHDGAVELIVRSPGTGFTPFVSVVCRATFDVLDGSRLPKMVEVENQYPCGKHETMMAHIFDGLYRLDSAIQRAYEQLELPE